MRVVFCILCFFVSSAVAETAESLLEQGKFDLALKSYESLRAGNRSKPRDVLGEGIAQYRLKRFDEASKTFLSLLEIKDLDPKLKFEGFYNLGNTLTQKKMYKEAIQQFESALKLLPTDTEAKENLEYVKKLLEEKSSGGGGGGAGGGGGGEEKQDSKNDGAEPEKQEQSGEGTQQKSEEQAQGSDSQHQGEVETKELSERMKALMGAVEGDRGPLIKFREEKALEELKQRNEEPSRKDW